MTSLTQKARGFNLETSIWKCKAKKSEFSSCYCIFSSYTIVRFFIVMGFFFRELMILSFYFLVLHFLNLYNYKVLCSYGVNFFLGCVMLFNKDCLFSYCYCVFFSSLPCCFAAFWSVITLCYIIFTKSEIVAQFWSLVTHICWSV